MRSSSRATETAPAAALGPTVLMVLSSGFAARTLLQTDVLTTLVEAGVRVVACTDNHDDPRLALHTAGKPVEWEPLRKPRRLETGARRAWLRGVVRVMRWQSLSGRDSAYYRTKYARKRSKLQRTLPRRVELPLHLLTTQVLWRSSRLRRATLRADVRMADLVTYDGLFERYRPDLVLGTGLGWFAADEVVMQEAARRGVPVAAVVHGWDNASSKGYRAVDPDLVVAWSDHMRDELLQLQDVSPEKVRVGGVVHWDHYVRQGALPSREELCAELGLDPAKRLLVYATPAPRKWLPGGTRFSGEDTVRYLAAATSAGSFGSDVQLVIRLHPKGMLSSAAGFREEIQTLAASHQDVHVDIPRMLSPARHDHPAPDDARTLGALMRHCDVLINMFSTTTLEALLNDRPVVMIGRAAHRARAEGELERLPDFDWEEFEHLRPILEAGAARTARCREELIETVRAYLDDPELDSEGRRRIVETEFGPLDGLSGRRSGRYLLELLGVPERARDGAPSAGLAA